MEVERRINDTDELAKLGWRDLAIDILANTWDFGEISELESRVIADKIVAGRITSAELRQGVAWACAHDAESSLVLQGVDQSQIHHLDLIESSARRLAHHAGRQALELVGSRRKLSTYSARRFQNRDDWPQWRG